MDPLNVAVQKNVSHREENIVMVRNLPFDYADVLLEDLFEQIGPVKRAYMIRGKGFGFVEFTDKLDADEAVSRMNGYKEKGRSLKVEISLKRGAKPKKVVDRAEKLKAKGKQVKATETDFQHKEKKEARRKENPVPTLLLSKIATQVTTATLMKELKKHGQVKNLIFPSPESSDFHRCARCEYATEKQAMSAIDKLDGCILGGLGVRARFLTTRAARLIVRNLPFKVTEYDMRNLFEPHGDIDEIRIVRDVKGKALGFGFVQYKELSEAEQAVKEANGKKIKGRKVAVDWALSKESYDARVAQFNARKDKEAAQAKANEETKSTAMVDESDSGNDSDSSSSDSSSSSGSESSSDSDDEETDTSKASASVDAPGKVEKKVKKKLTKEEQKEEQLQRTCFVRNLPFNAGEQDVKNLFKRFGRVRSVKICINRAFKRSKGSAFVCFDTAEAAQAAIEAAKLREDDSRAASQLLGGIVVEGRTIVVLPAVNRQKVKEIAVTKNVVFDKRNLYLSAEGYIAEDMPAAEGVSKGDLDLRAKGQQEKKFKLKNPNYTVSRVRLSVRNVPKDFTDKQLEKLCIEAVIKGRQSVSREEVAQDAEVKNRIYVKANDAQLADNSRMRQPIKWNKGSIFVTQTKIARDAERTSATSTKGRSKRFAFIEFEEHIHALACLRQLNNNPNAFGSPAARPIVEFALDDQRKLLIRRQRDAKRKSATNASSSKETEEALAVAEKQILAGADDQSAESVPEKKRGKKRARKDEDVDQNSVAAPPPKNKPAKNKDISPEKLAQQAQWRANMAAKKAQANATRQQQKKKKKALVENDNFEDKVQSYKEKLFKNVSAKPAKTGKNDKRWFEM